MSDATADDIGGDDPKARRKGGAKGLVLVAVLALALGGGGFYATWSGLVSLGGGGAAGGDPAAAEGDADAADGGAAASEGDGGAHAVDAAGAAGAAPGQTYLTLPPIAVSIGAGGADRQLRMQAILDVAPGHEAVVAALEPRIRDSLLGYLRALDPSVLSEPTALLRVRSQMLRRARMIAGDDAVGDLLVTDFVLN